MPLGKSPAGADCGQWLVDGYNYLHRSKGYSRESFFRDLASFTSHRKEVLTLVLDGRGPQEDFAAFQTRYLKISYSQKISADTWIEKCLCDRKSVAQARSAAMPAIHVVTEDRAIADMARGYGALVLKASDFSQLLKESQSDIKDLSQKQQVASHRFNRPFSDKLKDFRV